MEKKKNRVPLGEIASSICPNSSDPDPRGSFGKKSSFSRSAAVISPLFSSIKPSRKTSRKPSTRVSLRVSLEDLGALSHLQNRILESCALGISTSESLDQLCLLVEEMVPGSVASLFLYDSGKGVLTWGAGPNLPPDLKEEMFPLSVEPGFGSCPASILSQGENYVEDTLVDERWNKARHIAEKYGFRSCWSLPITDGEARVFGTFAISSKQKGGPNEFQKELLQTARYLAAVALMKDRYEKEQVQLNRSLQNHRRLESLGRFTGEIAHEFNNILTALLAYCDLLKGKALDDGSFGPGSLEDLKEIEQAGFRGVEIVRKLLLFCKEKPFEESVFSPNRVIEELCFMLRQVLREDLELNLSLTRKEISIRTDETTFGQSLLSLILNVRDQLSRGGRVLVKTDSRDSDPEMKPQERKDEVFLLHVCGVSADRQRTFKADLHREGLGMVQNFAKRAGGKFNSIQDSMDHSCWELSLPVFGSSGSSSAYESIPSQKRGFFGKGKKILVCEDEPSIRTLLKRILEEQGFEVCLAPDAEWAEKLFKEDPEGFDLLFTDIVLPGKNGFELACGLRGQRDDLPVILTSGYSHEIVPLSSDVPMSFPILKKPFYSKELLQAIGHLLFNEPKPLNF